MTIVGVVARLYPDLPAPLVPVARRQVHAHLRKLRDDGLVWWDANAIPYAVFPAVVYYVGLVVSPGFGISINGNIDDALEGAKRRLRRRVAKRSTGEATELSDY